MAEIQAGHTRTKPSTWRYLVMRSHVTTAVDYRAVNQHSPPSRHSTLRALDTPALRPHGTRHSGGSVLRTLRTLQHFGHSPAPVRRASSPCRRTRTPRHCTPLRRRAPTAASLPALLYYTPPRPSQPGSARGCPTHRASAGPAPAPTHRPAPLLLPRRAQRTGRRRPAAAGPK